MHFFFLLNLRGKHACVSPTLQKAHFTHRPDLPAPSPNSSAVRVRTDNEQPDHRVRLGHGRYVQRSVLGMVRSGIHRRGNPSEPSHRCALFAVRRVGRRAALPKGNFVISMSPPPVTILVGPCWALLTTNASTLDAQGTARWSPTSPENAISTSSSSLASPKFQFLPASAYS
ncbi:hypothetical protein EW146_g3158 [Bondarzewia mesenterica]|uniref:Uncharacterized protein n=1 Tax=Bondarzewia mesenterica TaxID=1095465 RepID=A0A4S4LYD3_9AGAM|nr:hypothetical protein EW146_g3158 [Bondarzewia mesenterica]